MRKHTRYTLSDPRVFDVEVSAYSSQETYYDEWKVSYASDHEESGKRVVVGTFRAGDSDVNLAVTVAGIFYSTRRGDPLEGEELETSLRTSIALETLYDVARMHARTLLAMVKEDLPIPSNSPEPIIRAIQDPVSATEVGPTA